MNKSVFKCKLKITLAATSIHPITFFELVESELERYVRCRLYFMDWVHRFVTVRIILGFGFSRTKLLGPKSYWV